MWTVGGAWSNPTQPFSLLSTFKSNTKQQHERQREIHICLYHMEMTGLKGGWGPEMSKMVGTKKARQQRQEGKISMERQIKLKVQNWRSGTETKLGRWHEDKMNTQQGQRHKHTTGVEPIRAVATKDKGGCQDRKWQGGIGPPLMAWQRERVVWNETVYPGNAKITHASQLFCLFFSFHIVQMRNPCP